MMVTRFGVAFVAFAYGFIFSAVHGYLLERDHFKVAMIWSSLGLILNGFLILFRGWDNYSQGMGDSMIALPYLIVGLVPGIAIGYYVGFNIYKFYIRVKM